MATALTRLRPFTACATPHALRPRQHSRAFRKCLCLRASNSNEFDVPNAPQPTCGFLRPIVRSLPAAVLLSGYAMSASAHDLAPLYTLADIDAATAHNIENILRPLFTLATLLYIIRIPMTWYPTIDGTKLPWLIAYAPTEPILKVTRQVIPLVGGVDVTPIVWVAVISFLNEILLGPQGILLLIQREGSAGF